MGIAQLILNLRLFSGPSMSSWRMLADDPVIKGARGVWVHG